MPPYPFVYSFCPCPMYLNCHTHFSLRYGVLSVAELVELARAHGIKQLALTDIHSTSACYDFVRACREAGIDPVIGMEFRKGDELLYIALARNLQGFREINEFYSLYAHQGLPFPDLPPYWSEVFVVYPWEKRERVSLTEREFLGVRPSHVRQLLRSRYRHRPDRLVALQPVTFADAEGQQLHRVLRAIDHNTLWGKLKNSQQAPADARFISPDTLREIFKDYPRILSNTERLLGECSFNFVFGQRRTRQTFTGGKYDDMLLLEKLAREGLRWRYGKHHPEATRRMERELEIIDQLDFNAYFLITWDFIQYGRSRGLFHVGRGSGANSLVAYCLGISDVDPIELDLYFERFLNPKRTSPPDFDIDYSWRDRDAVLDYVLKRYQSSHAVLLASYQRFQPRSALREVGKVFGLPKQEIDILTTLGLETVTTDEATQQVVHFAQQLQDFPDHLSIHAGGVLVSESPIHSYTATNMPPKGMPITHFDMHVAEEIGLHKFDILSQRGLGHIREAVEIVQDQGEAIDIHAVGQFKRDPEVRRLMQKGETVGCFYVESPAMRGLLRKLKCDTYKTLVAASSVIRPGVARSGMMRNFISRHNGAVFAYAHPRIGELLEETYGIMVYQEDVLKMVHGFAGLDLAEADLLRRAMSGKTRGPSAFEVLKNRFLDACLEKDYDAATTAEIWRQIESFAGYSFSKAHSASYAVESMQSLYLKAHYPLAFITAVVNNFGGFYSVEFYLHEARRWGAKIEAPCVNRSTHATRLEGETIFLGFQHIKDLETEFAERIERERLHKGDFQDLADFRFRMDASESILTLLVRVGALRFTGESKPNLLWETRMYRSNGKPQPQKETLFGVEHVKVDLPKLADSELKDAYDEMELLGFPLCSPFDLLEKPLQKTVYVQDLPQHLGKVVCMAGYFICAKSVKTVRGERMKFANFVDPQGDFLDVTIFPPEVKQYPAMGAGVYLLTGMVVEEFEVYSLELMVCERREFRHLGKETSQLRT